jgi:phospholipase C
MIDGHGDYHPAFGRSFFGGNVDIGLDAPSAMLGGEAFLERVFNAYRSATAEPGTNVWSATLLIGWDEPGGTYDHVPPGPVPPPPHAAVSRAIPVTAATRAPGGNCARRAAKVVFI